MTPEEIRQAEIATKALIDHINELLRPCRLKVGPINEYSESVIESMK